MEATGSRRRRPAAIARLAGLCFLAGWILPLASIGTVTVSAESDALGPWFHAMGPLIGIAAVGGGALSLADRRLGAGLIAVAAAAALGWSLLFPAAVFLAVRSKAGWGN